MNLDCGGLGRGSGTKTSATEVGADDGGGLLNALAHLGVIKVKLYRESHCKFIEKHEQTTRYDPLTQFTYRRVVKHSSIALNAIS